MREATFEPFDQLGKLLAGRQVLRGKCLAVRGGIEPELRRRAEQLRRCKTFPRQVGNPVVVGSHALRVVLQAAVPFVHYERERPPLPLFLEQIPPDLIVILFLRTDVEHDIGDRQQFFQRLAVFEIVAIDVRRVDEHLLCERFLVVPHEPTEP